MRFDGNGLHRRARRIGTGVRNDHTGQHQLHQFGDVIGALGALRLDGMAQCAQTKKRQPPIHP